MNTRTHALRYTALHYTCSVQCSLCTVSVQWSVAQSACVLRALCPLVFFFGQGMKECKFAESSLIPFPKGANMHSPCPTCFSSLE